MVEEHEWNIELHRPEDHPLWAEQVALEGRMQTAGGNKFKDRVIIAQRKGQPNSLPIIRHLIEDWLPPVVASLQSWIKTMDAQRGVRPIALPYLKKCNHHAAIIIGLRQIMNALASSRGSNKSPNNLTTIAMAIGRTVEHEERCRAWEAKAPGHFYKVQEEQQAQKATATHRRAVNIHVFNDLLKATSNMDIQWEAWSTEVIFRVGIAILDICIRTTGWFEVMPDPEYVAKRGRAFRQRLVLTAKPAFTKWLGRELDLGEKHSAEFKPCIMPPKRWTGSRNGGYYTPYVQAPRLVRFKASQEDQKARAADEYDALDISQELEALHVLQETAWRVNGRVLDVALEAWSRDLRIAGLPQIEERPLPPRTPRMILQRELEGDARAAGLTVPIPDPQTILEIKQWKRQATPVYGFNVRRVSAMRATTTTIQLAQEFRDREAIYFPHMLDFRGRKYPIPSFLQPQGNDLAKGLLTLGTTRPILDEFDAGWLAIHLANCMGVDKVSLKERIKWTEERREVWERVAADPLGNLDWCHKDAKPWQALAAIFEWTSFLTQGYGYESSLNVMSDGTCNGIQHLSALTLDATSGHYVNLVPEDEPQDIYRFVAQELHPILKRIAKAGGGEGAKATYWLDLCGDQIPRGATKRQVMVLPYGGSKDSFFKYTREWLDEADPVRPEVHEYPDAERQAFFEARAGRIGFFVTHLWDVVNHVVMGGMKVMKWLQDCAKASAMANQPIYWVTPTGFVVRHFYGVKRVRVCKLLLDGERYELNLSERTAKLSMKEQLQGIAPNYIHSLDAAALTETLRLCKAEGITAFAAVHDAYGTHASNMWPLARILRQAFVNIHRTKPLEAYRNACLSVIVGVLVAEKGLDPFAASQRADDMLPPLPEMGKLDLDGVMESDYFFA